MGKSEEESLQETLPIKDVAIVFETFSVITSVTCRLLSTMGRDILKMYHT